MRKIVEGCELQESCAFFQKAKEVGEETMAGALCGVPAAVTYWYLLDVARIGDGIIAPVMVAWIMGFGAVGGLISFGIQFFQQTMQDR